MSVSGQENLDSEEEGILYHYYLKFHRGKNQGLTSGRKRMISIGRKDKANFYTSRPKDYKLFNL